VSVAGVAGRPMRTDLTLDDLDGFLELPVVAVLATHRPDGMVLLSPVWHRWRDGGFEIWVGGDDVKVRHLRRDPRATVLVAETDLPYRGVEVRGEAEFIDRDVTESALEIASRYVGDERGAAFVGSSAEDDLIVRVAPGEVRVWDFADDFPVA
jgi:PPOX class probable F420-dependent enzyme